MASEPQPYAVYHGRGRGNSHKWSAAIISLDAAGNRTVHWESPPQHDSLDKALRAAEAEFKTFRRVPAGAR